ncbi:MAG TPA: cation transporting ATPase C-terminal domain-containing protein, partial [Thermoanaerobaculia bacterium]
FDLLTFAALLTLFRSSAEVFRTSWFIESLLTELLIALVVRTRRPFFRSRPGKVLLVSTIVLVVLTFAIPYLPMVRVLGFVPLPFPIVAMLSLIAAAYIVAAEMMKRWFYRSES